ncbi:MAG TPA: hypothetical protein VNN12_03900 [Dehalococcoidia bacterium]|nr:hypothetical protein [Dehalococcoidia bacterium]
MNYRHAGLLDVAALSLTFAPLLIVACGRGEPGARVVELFLRFGGGDVTYGLLLDVR